MSLTIPFDNGSVVTSYNDIYGWMFTTIHDPFNGSHPVSGNRSFGLSYDLDTGEYIFYIQGADRITDYSGQLVGQIANLSTNPIQFGKADALWSGMMSNLARYINNNGGTARVKTPLILRPDWADVKSALENHRPLTSVPCPD